MHTANIVLAALCGILFGVALISYGIERYLAVRLRVHFSARDNYYRQAGQQLDHLGSRCILSLGILITSMVVLNFLYLAFGL